MTNDHLKQVFQSQLSILQLDSKKAQEKRTYKIAR